MKECHLRIAWKLIFLGAVMIGIGACMADQSGDNSPKTYNNNAGHPPTYSTNGSDDDNGVEPMPNNGSQNFGRRH